MVLNGFPCPWSRNGHLAQRQAGKGALAKPPGRKEGEKVPPRCIVVAGIQVRLARHVHAALEATSPTTLYLSAASVAPRSSSSRAKAFDRCTTTTWASESHDVTNRSPKDWLITCAET
jgi:hypothetical protein